MDQKTKQLVRLGLMTAAVAAVTMVVSLPVPNVAGAYINGGDAVVYVAAYLFGPVGAVSAAVGSALADLLLGSAIYAPGTFIIKGAMALLAALALKKWSKPAVVFAVGLLMPLGYFLYESVLFGVSAAWAGVGFNLIQYAAGTALSYALIKLLGARGHD